MKVMVMGTQFWLLCGMVKHLQKQIKKDAVSFPLFTRAYAMAKAQYLDLGFAQKSWSFYDPREVTRILKH